jgi:hypothetical protein
MSMSFTKRPSTQFVMTHMEMESPATMGSRAVTAAAMAISAT